MTVSGSGKHVENFSNIIGRSLRTTGRSRVKQLHGRRVHPHHIPDVTVPGLDGTLLQISAAGVICGGPAVRAVTSAR